ncbi:hypothetical protein J4Q44_G00369480 [Coregonus suidteri]|uniref:Uncharacterized protein n=1 Tax=Coregonus suidteri TaxID=861788 RepID=A0AAN8KMR0_9TELE
MAFLTTISLFLVSPHRKCSLSGQTKTCKHRIKFGDSSSYYYVSPFAVIGSRQFVTSLPTSATSTKGWSSCRTQNRCSGR